MRPRRLSLDTKKLEEPQDCYTYGKNGVWNANIGAEENENGFLPSGITIPYKVIGIIETDTFPVYFSTDNVNSAFGFHDVYKDIYVPIFDDAALSFKLSFNINRPIKGEYRRNFKNEIELTWLELASTGANPPRWANTVTLGTDPNDFLLFPKSLIPFITTQVQPGGNLGMGAYFFGLQYIRNDGTLTRYTTLTAPVIAVSDNYGTIPGANTGKAVTINITGLDLTYDRIGLVVVERINGVDTPYTLPELPIAPNITFIYTGAEKQTQLTMDEVLIPAAYYENAYAITQMDDQLFLGNMTEESMIDWQQYASMVKIQWKSELTNVATRPNIPVESGKQRGWMHEEVAAFYMVLKLRSGRNSRGFVCVGPVPQSGDLIQSTLATAQSITAKVYQVEDTCRNIDVTNKTGDCGVWINEDELYPDIPQFDSSSVGGENLRNQPVRHHRMPSLRFCKQNLYAGNPDYGRASLDTLGLQVSNVIIPAELQNLVIGWELHYAKKDYNNALVLGQSLTMFGAQANQDAGTNGNITSTGGNWGSYQRTHSSGATTDPESLKIVNNHIRFHALDLLYNRPSITPSYINLQITSVLRFNNNCLAVNNANEVIYSLDYTNGAGNVDPTSLPTDSNHLYKVELGQYVTTNSNSDDFSNIRLEDAYVMRLPFPGPSLMNTSGWTWIKRDYTNGLNNQPVFEIVYLANLMALRANVYLNYYSQTLVRTGYVFPATVQASTETIYGGDTFLSKYSFTTYGLVTKKDVVTNTGITDWKTADTDGIKAVHFFICESVSDGAARYEIPGDTYSQFPPKSTLTGGTNIFLYGFSRNNNPNSIGYTRDCNSVGDLLNGILLASPYDQFVQTSPTKIVRSVKQVSESVVNSWKNFNALDYYEAVKNKGPIINLCGMNDRIIIHHKDAIFITRSKATFNTDIVQVTLGTGDIFQFQPNEVRPAHLGYGGTLNPLACLLTPIGYMYPDNITGELLLFDGTNLNNIGVGLINFLLKYMTVKEINNYIGNGIIIGYEQFYKRILLTVKNIGLSSNSLVFVPNFVETPEFFATLTANTSVVYKDGRYQLFKGINSSEFNCNAEQFPALADAAFTSNEFVPNGTVLGTLTATGGVGAYTYIITTINKGGVGINPLTGQLTVVDSAAFEYTESVLNLAVRVTDSAGNSATNNTAITINQVASIPVLPAYSVQIPEHSANGTLTNTEVATDRDGKAITYSITGGNGLGGFTIDPTTGIVTVANGTVLDFFDNPNFTLTIRATASNGSFAENVLIISLGYVYQPPVISNVNFTTINTVANGTVVATITPAVEREGGDLVYELVSDSTPAGAFQVILDPTDPDFLKVKVLNNTLLDPADDEYIITLRVYEVDHEDSPSIFTIDGHVFAYSSILVNLAEQTTPTFVDGNGEVFDNGVSVGTINTNGSATFQDKVTELLTIRATTSIAPVGASPTQRLVVHKNGSLVYDTTIVASAGAFQDYTDTPALGDSYVADITTAATLYSSIEKSGTANRNNCGSGTGSPVVYTVPASTYTSAISQADADAQAQADVDANKQSYANSHGICTYASVEKSGTANRNDCTGVETGSAITYTVPAGTYTSIISQADADSQAQSDVDSNKQAYANSHGICVPGATVNNNLTEQASPFIDVNSNINLDGVTLSQLNISGSDTHLVPAGHTLDFIANTNVTSGTTDPLMYLIVNKNGIQVFAGNVPVVAGNQVVYSTISESGATYDAFVYSTNVAAFSNARLSQVFEKAGCGAGFSGTAVEYVVPAGTYTSSVSQADADSQAAADVAANGQNNANTNGSCVLTNNIATLLVDYDVDANADLCFFCSTPGTAEENQIVASSLNGGPLQLPNDGRDPAGCFVLASDKLSGPPTRRFGANLAYFIVNYPAINIFTFDMVGRSTVAQIINGSYAKRDASEGHLIMGIYSDGISKIPGVSGATLATIVNYTTHVGAGANGAVGVGVGSPVLRLTYNVSANTITATTF